MLVLRLLLPLLDRRQVLLDGFQQRLLLLLTDEKLFDRLKEKLRCETPNARSKTRFRRGSNNEEEAVSHPECYDWFNCFARK